MTGESVPPVLLYDGVCGVCNSAVRTILRFDPNGTLRFAALDTTSAGGLRSASGDRGVDSVVFVDEPGQPAERVAVRSAAALRVVDYLGGPWKLLQVAASSPLPCATGSTTGSPTSAIASSGVRHVSAAAAGGSRALLGQLTVGVDG